MCSRKKRDAVKYNFEAEHVVILYIKALSNNVDTEIELFVLDPTSKSLIPDRAFTSENLKKLILEMYQGDNNDLSFPLKSVDEVHPEASTGGEESSSKAPVVAGVIVALLVLICAVVAAWFYLRRRRNSKRYVLF